MQLYCSLAIEKGVSQDEINRTLTEFFSGHPSVSSAYNHTVSAGSAKPASVQERWDVMRSMLPGVEGPDNDEEDFENMYDMEQEDDHGDI